MFWKKKQNKEVAPVQPAEPKNKKIYGADSNFPHILLSYILIFFLACLMIQIFASQQKISSQNQKIERYLHMQDVRVGEPTKQNKGDFNGENENQKKHTINNYYYGQSPHSQNSPNFPTEYDR